jgi:hypothetical protein
MTSKTKCFVSFGEMKPFVFAVLAAYASETKRTVARWAMELPGLGIFVHEGLEMSATRRPRPEDRCAASRLEGRSEATNTFVAALRSLRQVQGGLSRLPRGASERGLGNSKARKKLRRSAVKSLKQLVRVNLCATPREGSEADDSR